MKNRLCNRQKHSDPVGNEDGYVLVITLLIMLVLTVIGLASIKNTSIELQIAGNDKLYMEDFYTSEANAFMAAQFLEMAEAEDLEKFEFGLDLGGGDKDGFVSEADITGYDPVDGDLESYIDDFGHEIEDGDPTEKYLVVSTGEAAGSSLVKDGASTSIYSFDVYGYSSVKNGKKIIRLGYKKRY